MFAQDGLQPGSELLRLPQVAAVPNQLDAAAQLTDGDNRRGKPGSERAASWMCDGR